MMKHNELEKGMSKQGEVSLHHKSRYMSNIILILINDR